MYKDEYDSYALNHLHENELYAKLNKIPILTITRKNNLLVRKLLQRKHIDEDQSKKLLSSHSSLAEMYFLPKIHKETFKVRPIVSYINYPTFWLSKYIAEPLKAALNPNYSLKNSFELVNTLQQLKIAQDDCLFSFDIESMYTSIPTNIAIQAIKRKWKSIKEHTKISQDLFLEIVQLCIRGTYFVCTVDPCSFYEQCEGRSIGSILAPIVSNYVLDMILNDTFSNNPDLKPTFIKYYVDDIFLISNTNISSRLLEKLNEFHPKIKFTSEKKSNFSLEFLDILILRNPEFATHSTKWHRKYYQSSRILNFHSEHHYNIKYSILFNTFFRALKLTSPQHRVEIIKLLKSLSGINNYPKHMTLKILKNATNKLYNSNLTEAQNDQTKYISLPYFQDFPTGLNQSLNKLHVKPVFKYNHQIKSLFSKLKAKKDPMMQTNLVYKIDCLMCTSNSYIGSTSQLLKNRIYHHKNDLKLGNAKTGLQQHSMQLEHRFDFDNAKILATSNDNQKRFQLENCFINSISNINRQTDNNNFPSTYKPLFDFVKKHKLFK